MLESGPTHVVSLFEPSSGSLLNAGIVSLCRQVWLAIYIFNKKLNLSKIGIKKG